MVRSLPWVELMLQTPESRIRMILRRLQADLAHLTERRREMQARLTSVEQHLAGVAGRLARLQGDLAAHRRSIDRLEDRFAVIERRPERSETAAASLLVRACEPRGIPRSLQGHATAG
jgi:chromosome segregation ATPase